MQRLLLPNGLTLSYDRQGRGTPLVLVHGGFSDHRSNWEFVIDQLAQIFDVYAVARRGRGETSRTVGHTLEDEAADVAALIESIPDPVFLAGHSYGAHVSLGAALRVPDRVRKLAVYEAPWPSLIGDGVLSTLRNYASVGDWDRLSFYFFSSVLRVPTRELESLRNTELWPPILADAPASLNDLTALNGCEFQAERYAALPMPVLLQIGAESPRDFYLTDVLEAMLPNARLETFAGQAHEAMTTSPALYAESLVRFFTDAGSAAA